MTNKLLAATALAVCLLAGTSDANAQARDQIRIVGSSTVFPFTTAVAEQFGRTPRFRTPVVESTGTGGGIRLFCAGIGPQHPDFVNASRPMTATEFDTCAANGVTQIVKMNIGYDGIVLAVRRGTREFNVTRAQIWRALAREVPVNGQLVANPHTRWNEIDPALPNWAIEVIGPPPTSGTRDAFAELVMDVGCRDVPEIRAITDSAARRQACQRMREDGRFIEGGENDNLIVQRIAAGREGLIGLFGYSFLAQNRDRVDGKPIEGIEPTFENIANGSYPVARSLFVYAKAQHADVIPGMREFIAEFMSERAMGDTGYLPQRGLITFQPAERRVHREAATNMTPMARP